MFFGSVGPPTLSCSEGRSELITENSYQTHWKAQFTISLNFFIGKHLTVLLAGFALKTHGSLVKGLRPFLAAVAGFFLSFMLRTPPSLNLPFFFNSVAPRARYAVMTPLTTFALRPCPSATAENAALAVKPDAPAFFMVFIAGAIVRNKIKF